MAIGYRYGETAPVLAPVLTAQAVAIGDMCALSSGNVIRAEDVTWDTNLATTQAAFAAAFLGISGQLKIANEDTVVGNSVANQIRIDTHGVYDVPIASATTLLVGDFLAPAKDTGNNLLSQSCAKTTVQSSAIFVVVLAGTSLTTARARVYNPNHPV